MSDFTSVTAAIKAKLLSITDIGEVIIGWPAVVSWNEYLEKFLFETGGGDKVIRVWIIYRPLMQDIWVTNTQSYSEQEYRVDGYLGFSDGITAPKNEAEFQEFLEEVFTALREDYKLNDTFDTREPPAMVITQELFGRVFCHVARMAFKGQIDKTF